MPFNQGGILFSGIPEISRLRYLTAVSIDHEYKWIRNYIIIVLAFFHNVVLQN